jgi:broad specificity phosphatase PhoE
LKTLYFVRHGETDWNTQNLIMGQRDLPLNANGRAQAALTASRLAQIPFTACYSSDLCRAFETAKIILQGRGLAISVSVDQRLREINYGVFEGTTAKEWPTLFPHDFTHYQADPLRHSPTNGESRLQLMARIDSFLTDLINANSENETILVLTHGGTLTALFNLLLAKETAAEPTFFHRLFRFDNCSINILRFEHNHWRILLANDCSYLK